MALVEPIPYTKHAERAGGLGSLNPEFRSQAVGASAVPVVVGVHLVEDQSVSRHPRCRGDDDVAAVRSGGSAGTGIW